MRLEISSKKGKNINVRNEYELFSFEFNACYTKAILSLLFEWSFESNNNIIYFSFFADMFGIFCGAGYV